jgi:hypothetical protein
MYEESSSAPNATIRAFVPGGYCSVAVIIASLLISSCSSLLSRLMTCRNGWNADGVGGGRRGTACSAVMTFVSRP